MTRIAERPTTRPPRVRYLDLMRVAAICGVVVGHWLVVDITYGGGRLTGRDALAYVGRASWLTLVFQLMPVFFVIGGYVNAVSWTGHQGRGLSRAGWVQSRVERLLWPTTLYVALSVVASGALAATVLDADETAQSGRLLTLHLWFLPVYLLMITLTPVMLAAHRRWGMRVVALMAVGAALVDAGVLALHLPLVGYANCLLVWGSMHQWGFAWQDGSLSRHGSRPLVLAGAGALCFIALVTAGPYPVDMIGAGGRAGNTSPPTLALLAFAATQTGLMLAAGPSGTRYLHRSRRLWRRVGVLNGAAMTVYLWHMVPVLVVALLVYRTVPVPQPRIGSWSWWLGRPVWVAVLAVLLALVAVAATWLQRPLRLIPPARGPLGAGGVAMTSAGLAASAAGLVLLAADGTAPGGRVAVTSVVIYGSGVVLTMLAGHSRRLRPAGPAG